MLQHTLAENVKYNLRRDLNNIATRQMTVKTYDLQPDDYEKHLLTGDKAEQMKEHLSHLKSYRQRVQDIVMNGNEYKPKKIYRYELTPKGIKHVMAFIKKHRTELMAQETQGVDDYPKNLKHLYLDANRTLYSDLTSYQIEKGTGMNHSTILRLRNPHGKHGHMGLRKAPLKTLALLAGYPNTTLMKFYKFNKGFGRTKLKAYLYTSLAEHDFSVRNLKSDIANLMTFTKNMAELHRRTGISRTKLQRIAGRSGNQFYDPLYLKADDISQLTKAWQRKKLQLKQLKDKQHDSDN